ncbi:hypothetical protein ACWGBV_03435 [Streptomyces sp. NPDC055051]
MWLVLGMFADTTLGRDLDSGANYALGDGSGPMGFRPHEPRTSDPSSETV